jgi:hypothetical protein
VEITAICKTTINIPVNLKETSMKEYMLLIRNQVSSKEDFSPEQHEEFLDSCKVYIDLLKNERRLISAQPMIREGRMLSCPDGVWKETSYQEADEVIVGYYHLLAKDLDEAIDLAKKNPEFKYTTTARIEVRPIKMREETTGFVYPILA